MGAKIAVDVACELLAEALDNHRNQVGISDRRLEQFLDGSLAKQIIWEWNQRLNIRLKISEDGAWNERSFPMVQHCWPQLMSEPQYFFQLGDGISCCFVREEAGVLSNLGSMERSHIHCVNPAATTTQSTMLLVHIATRADNYVN